MELDTNTKLAKYRCKDSTLLHEIKLHSSTKELIAALSEEEKNTLFEIEIPEGIKIIGKRCFNECKLLEKIKLPSSLKELGNAAFQECHSLHEIELPEGLEAIGEYCFNKCETLEKVNIPSSLKKLEGAAFQECHSLHEIELPEGLEAIGDFCFNKCETLEKVNIPSSLKKLEECAFQLCKSLCEVILPNTLKELEEYTFTCCEKLKKIEFPEGLEKIGKYCFNECKSLEKIKLPSSLKELGEGSFNECHSLYEIELPEGLETIGEFCFDGCELLKKINLPSSLKKLGSAAFQDCESLCEVILPSALKELETYTFTCCEKLKKIEFPEELEKIGKYCFAHCESLEEITIPITIKEIDRRAFYKCKKLKRIIFKLNNEEEKNSEEVKQLAKKIKNKINRSAEISFVVANKEEIKIETTQEKDIAEQLDKIKEICQNLPIDTRNTIYKKVKSILNEYLEKKENVRPQFGKSQDMLSYSISGIKTTVLVQLESIVLKLSTEKKLVDFISKLEEYNKIINGEQLEIDKEDFLGEKISNIVLMLKYLDEKRTKKYADILNQYLEETKNNITDFLGKDKKQELTLNYIDYIQDFKTNISNLHEEVSLSYEKLRPYIVLLNALNNSSNLENDIAKDLNSINIIISKITNEKYKADLEAKYNGIREIYTSKILEEINSEELPESTKYNELEKNLRTDIIPLLELISKYATNISYEEKNVNKERLKDEINKAIDFLENNKKSKHKKSSTIISFTEELYSELINNQELSDYDKKVAKNALIRELKKELTKLEEKNIVTLEDYKKEEMLVLSKIARIKIDLIMLTYQNIEFNKNTR